MLAAFLDIETTGLDPYKHRVLEIAIRLVDLGSNTTLATYETDIRQPREIWNESDPASLKVNGFTWERSQAGKEEANVSREIQTFLSDHQFSRGKGVFIAQNSSVDRAFFAQIVNTYDQERLNWPYHWLDLASMFWNQATVRHKTPITEIKLSKNAIAKFYGMDPEPSPHRAINGVDHLLKCYYALIGNQGEQGQ